jgi:hypothetical protein
MLAGLVLSAALASVAARTGPSEFDAAQTDSPGTQPQRQPVAPAPAPQEDLRRLTVAQLLERIPADLAIHEPLTCTLTAEQLELRRRAEAHELSDDDWRTALGAADAIHVRPLWPADVPLHVWIREPAWLYPSKITARAVRPELGTIEVDNLHADMWLCGQAMFDMYEWQRRLALAALPNDTTHVLFDVRIYHLERRTGEWSLPPSALVWHGNFEVKVHATADVDRVLPLTENPAVERALRQSIKLKWLKRPRDSKRYLFLTAGNELMRAPALRSVGFSLVIELRHDGVLVDKVPVVADQHASVDGSVHGLFGCASFNPLADDVADPSGRCAGWELRVTGTPDRVLWVWEAESWWKGGFTMPLAEAFANAQRE